MSAAEHDKRLHAEIGALRFDPLGYVMYAFPWGRAGTALADEHGPEERKAPNVTLISQPREWHHSQSTRRPAN